MLYSISHCRHLTSAVLSNSYLAVPVEIADPLVCLGYIMTALTPLESYFDKAILSSNQTALLLR